MFLIKVQNGLITVLWDIKVVSKNLHKWFNSVKMFAQLAISNPNSFLFRRQLRANTYEPAVFFCISMLARAVGPQVETEMKKLLDQMFSAGLSAELTSALKVLAQEIPNLHRDIQGV